jgi:hypothetical protein
MSATFCWEDLSDGSVKSSDWSAQNLHRLFPDTKKILSMRNGCTAQVFSFALFLMAGNKFSCENLMDFQIFSLGKIISCY